MITRQLFSVLLLFAGSGPILARQVIISADTAKPASSPRFSVTRLERPVTPDRPPANNVMADSLRVGRYTSSLTTLPLMVPAHTAIPESTKSGRLSTGRELTPDRLREVPSILPLYVAPTTAGITRTRFSSGFGIRQHPVLGGVVSHNGIDLPAPMGTFVYATADGVCSQIINQSAGIGLAISLTHGRLHETLYGHLLSAWVKPGESVRRGQIIGRVGVSGLTTGPHLHYGVRYRGQVVDPLPYCFLLSRRTPG